MRHDRRRILTAALTMLLFTGGWLAVQSARPERTLELTHVSEWQTHTWYRLDGHGPSTTCELQAGHHYRLVLGCLGEATQDHSVSVRLTASRSSPRGDDRGVLNAEPLTRLVGPWSKPAIVFSPSSSPRDCSHQPLVGPRDFFLHVTDGDLDDPKQYARITADNMACGTRVRIFVDQQLAAGEVSQSRIDELVSVLEDDVVPRVESQFGPLSDVDGDGCLAIVLTPWLSRLQGGRTSIGGMVRSSDFQRDVSPPLGNRCDMLFLNSSLPSDAALRDLLSHEVAHAACISQRLSRGIGKLRDEDDWLSEALAHLAEPGWTNLDHRLAAFLDDPSRFPLVVPDYYRAGLWRNPGCRGATYLFTRWCIEHRGPQLVRQLAQSVERGRKNIERATGRQFEDLFREWNLSLADGVELTSPGLRSALHRLASAGLQPTICHDASSKHTLQVRGTAFTIVDLLVDEPSPRTLRIAGDSTAKWQFSICRRPDGSHGRTQNNTLAAIKP